MSSSSTGSMAHGPVDVGIQPRGYEAILWCSVALPFFFVVGRLYVRAHVFRKLFVDDGLVVFAWLLQVAYCAIQQKYINDSYYILDLGLGLVQIDASMPEHFAGFQIASASSNVLHAIGLWSVKFSFLVFFRRLGSGVRHQTIIWWTVACFNAACFAVWLGVIAWPCLMHPFTEVIAQCASDSAAQYSLRVPKIQASMDIASDCAILIIPFALLWRVRLRWQQKVSLGSIFSVTLFIMAVSVVRTQGSVQGSQALNEIWLYGWTAIELGVAIVVACLASFRALFTGQGTSQATSYGPSSGEDSIERRGLSRLRGRLFGRSPTSMDAESGLVDRKSPLVVSQDTARPPVSMSGLHQEPKSLESDRSESSELESPVPVQVYIQTRLEQSTMSYPKQPNMRWE